MSGFVKFDPRILVAEDAYHRLLRITRYRRLNLPVNWSRVIQLVDELGHLIHRVKYMFLPPSQLAKLSEVEGISRLTGELARLLLDRELLNRFKQDKLVITETKYSLRILYGLKYRLLLGDEPDPLYSVDIEGVEVTSVHKHPRADKLYVTRAEGILRYTIITNIRDIKRGEIRAAAILPPVEFMGIVSEAMYCSKPLSPKYKGRRPPHDLIDVKEVRSQIYKIMVHG